MICPSGCFVAPSYRDCACARGEAGRGYGDGIGTDLTAFISDQMRNDWKNNSAVLMAFWQSGKHTAADAFPDSLPWLFVRGSADTLPWAAVHLD